MPIYHKSWFTSCVILKILAHFVLIIIERIRTENVLNVLKRLRLQDGLLAKIKTSVKILEYHNKKKLNNDILQYILLGIS